MNEAQYPKVTVRVSGDTLKALDAKVQSFEFGNVSEAARHFIEAGLRGDGFDIEDVKTVAADLRERKLTAEVTARELENAKAIGSVIAKDDVVDVWTKMCEPLRQSIQQVGNAVDGLDDAQRAQLAKWAEDTMTNLSGGGFE